MPVDKFDDFMVDLILEKVKQQDMPLVISKRLIKVLEKINGPIAERLINADDDGEQSKVTLLDYDDDNYANFIVTQSPKIFDYMAKIHYSDREEKLENSDTVNSLKKYFSRTADNNIDYWKVNRVSTKIGRVINKLFPGEFKPSGKPGEDIESFTNSVKSMLSKRFDDFKIVSGEDIKKYYLDENNVYSQGSPLSNSCMRYSRCQDYLEFYAKNDVKLLVLMDEDSDKIKGRALLWTIDKVYKSPGHKLISESGKTMTFMDRIYYTSDYQMDTFKDYAISKGWMFKENQNMDSHTNIWNPMENDFQGLQLITTKGFKKNDTYPYMDTMKWFNVGKGVVSNRNLNDDYDEVIFMEDTHGGFTMEGSREWSEYYGEWIDTEHSDMVFCELGDEWRYVDDAVRIEDGWDSEWATREYVEDNMEWSDIEEKYINDNDVVRLPRYNDVVSQGYADNYMSWSNRNNEYILDEDAVYSEYYNDNLWENDSVEVYTDIDLYNTDWREQDDGTYDTVIIDGNNVFLDNDVINMNFNKVITNYTSDRSGKIQATDFVYMPIDDEGKTYFKWKGKYYINKFKDELTGQLRLWEKRTNN